jgi:hypothetical protein
MPGQGVWAEACADRPLVTEAASGSKALPTVRTLRTLMCRTIDLMKQLNVKPTIEVLGADGRAFPGDRVVA